MKKLLLTCILIFGFHFSHGQTSPDVFDIARKGTLEQAKEKLKENPNSFNVVNNEGYSPLILAAYRGNNEVAKFLIESGSDINAKSSMGTPLMACIVKGNLEIAKTLIDKKADVNFADANGNTALIYAVKFNNIEALKLLLKSNIDKKYVDKSGKTAFEHAVFAGNQEIINLLK